jgi:cellulose synthase/poly-beta-1,6-N-acetylglucosamine synthase-like glycosyltransferase
MISIVITSFKEPVLIRKAIQAAMDNKINDKYELLVVAPDKETEEVVREFSKKYNFIKYFRDPGKGKSFALNKIFNILKGEIWIFTDGDVQIDKNAILELLKPFKEPKVGCVTGRPISTNSKKEILGYWSHLLFDAGAHNIRSELNKKGEFLEGTGYLFGFRKGIIKEIPLDVAEDTFIPYKVMKQGYDVRYADKAMVYVKNPTNLKDFIKQKVRTAKAHETLQDYEKQFPRVKSFKNEIFKGTKWALQYPTNLKEYLWTGLLFPTRLYIWMKVKWEDKITKNRYGDSWERIESTKNEE